MDKTTDQEDKERRSDTRSSDEILISKTTDTNGLESIRGQNTPDGAAASSDISGSPAGSQTSQSTSSRRSEQRRIVELLQMNNDKNDNSNSEENWMIGEGFYHEDVAAANDDESDLSNDEGDDDEVYHQVVDIASDSNEDDENDDVVEEDGEDSDVDVAILGFELAPNDGEEFERELSSDEDTNDGDEEQDANAIQYDISIPNQHRYLGENLEESRGRRILAENTIVKLPLFDIDHIVLMPGQALPINASNFNPRIQMYLLSCIERGDCLVGLWSGSRDHLLGTTAEIRNYTRSSEEVTNVILEGRQRFSLMSPPFVTAIEGIVRILPEVNLGLPYQEISSWRRFSMHEDHFSTKFIVSKHPKWLLNHYEANSIVRRIVKRISNWCINAPTRDPNAFSYWVASNLPISNIIRLQVLQCACLEARLLCLLELLDGENEYLGCSTCHIMMCHRDDVFLMSSSGPQNSYVNPHGFVHDTLTVNKAVGLIYDSRNWSSEYTWFPGYAWKIAHCNVCFRHVGWCFKATQSDLKPKRFWGLTRASVRLQSSGDRAREGADSQND